MDDASEVELGVLVHGGRRVAEAIEREARRRGADEIVIADPRASGMRRRELRRLQPAEPSVAPDDAAGATAASGA